MATLVLTAVGSAIGGPVGGAIGSVVGQQVDNLLFAPKSRQGPRLKELEVQTSSYGTQIPAIFGAMRVAGTVIWATNLIERRTKSGGGKGKPSTTQYSYSVSMAVAISSTPVGRIGRIWADGNLLRGVGGDFKVDTVFRLHSGHDDQSLDPLIASAEAAGQCPAYRGLAYAVFEDLQLADYGNRIPSLTFEIFERETVVPLNTIFGEASAGAILGSSDEAVIGYALSGADARSAISPLLDSFPVIVRSKAGKLELLDQWLPAGIAPTIEPVAQSGGKNYDRAVVALAPAHIVPRELTVRHYEPARDFQAGLQSSERSGAGRSSLQIELPAALDAAAAKRVAELGLLTRHRERESWITQGAVNSDRLFAGQWINDPAGRMWQIAEIEHFRGSTKISARSSLPLDPAAISAASPGRNVGSPDLTSGFTELAVIDLPVLDTTDPGRMVVGIFANGTQAGWRRTALSVQQDGGLIEVGPSAAPATIGRSIVALAPHSSNLLDSENSLDVQLAHENIEFPNGGSISAICCAGGEFIRFGSVTPLANGQYRLSDLQRGCFGTEAAIYGHQIGERFILLETQTVRLLEGVALLPGSPVTVEGLGIGDAMPVIAMTALTGKAIAPLSPVHAKGWLLANGGVGLSWVRRSRIDFGWNDGVDHPSVENDEQYSVSLSVDGEITNSWITQTSALELSSETVADLVASVGQALVFSVRQIGRHMQSIPAIIELVITQ